MARPSSRSRRVAAEEEPPTRRGRAPVRRPSGPPPALLAVGALVVVGAVVAALLLGGGEKKAPPREEPAALAPEAPPEKAAPPKAPPKAPPPPLTDKERAYVEGLFKQAEPHMKRFYEFADQGWKLEDEEERNRVWLKAKDAAHTAIQIVSEAMEDYDQFPQERQDAHMQSFNNRLAQWTKDLAQKIGKVHK